MLRTGSTMYNGSGDYAIAFSNATQVRRRLDQPDRDPSAGISNDAASSVFLAAVEATEEAIYNAMLQATTVRGFRGSVLPAVPLDSTLTVLKKYNALGWDRTLPPGKPR